MENNNENGLFFLFFSSPLFLKFEKGDHLSRAGWGCMIVGEKCEFPLAVSGVSPHGYGFPPLCSQVIGPPHLHLAPEVRPPHQLPPSAPQTDWYSNNPSTVQLPLLSPKSRILVSFFLTSFLIFPIYPKNIFMYALLIRKIKIK